MTSSSFSWLSYDASERQRALEVVESLKQPGTVDELGIGVVRDTIARALFPGASVLHTRARYFTFVAALVALATKESTAEQAIKRLTDLEGDLIFALLKGDPDADGLIGRDAKRQLKRMPSLAYWAAMRRYGVVTVEKRSVDQVVRMAVSSGRSALKTAVDPDDDQPVGVRVYGLDPTAARGWLPAKWKQDGASFDLDPKEAEYLRERIVTSTSGSLYAWFLSNKVAPAGAAYAWTHERAEEYPDEMRVILDHGERFHHLIHGAALRYNLLVSEAVEDAELVEGYEGAIDVWEERLGDDSAHAGWSVQDFLGAVRRLNPRLRGQTCDFIATWDGLVRSCSGPPRERRMAELIKAREWQTKKARARLFNPAARDDWRGGAGLVELDYNWSVAARIVDDVLNGLP